MLYNLLIVKNKEDKMEFVVCDDEKLFRSNVVKIIDKIYMNNNEEYKIHEFIYWILNLKIIFLV